MVLVVDDNSEVRLVMMRLLNIDGYEAAAVASGQAALDFLKARHPHCVILDVSMPDMDGFEVLASIRAEPLYANVRVIMYSAFDGEFKTRAMDLGADAFVQKGSLDWAKVQQVLNHYCGHGRNGGHRESTPPACNREVC